MLGRSSLPRTIILLLRDVSRGAVLQRETTIIAVLPRRGVPEGVVLEILVEARLLRMPVLPRRPRRQVLPLLKRRPGLLPTRALLRRPRRLRIVLPTTLLITALRTRMPLGGWVAHHGTRLGEENCVGYLSFSCACVASYSYCPIYVSLVRCSTVLFCNWCVLLCV